MNTVRLLGRLSVTLLAIILFEGLLTLGKAFSADTYSTPLAWIVQILIMSAAVWFASEWHYEQTQEK